jgi:hypothetical protein
MSHIVQVQTQVRDPNAIKSACTRIGLPAPVDGTANLFMERPAGFLVQFPGWLYPAVIDTASGTVRYDNYQGKWGTLSELDRFLQMYAVEKVKIESRARVQSPGPTRTTARRPGTVTVPVPKIPATAPWTVHWGASADRSPSAGMTA